MARFALDDPIESERASEATQAADITSAVGEVAAAVDAIQGERTLSAAIRAGAGPEVVRALEDQRAITDPAIERAMTALGELAGPDRLFRPFGRGGLIGPHLFNRRVVDHLCANSYTVVLWKSVPHDWDDPTGWPSRARADIDANDHTVVVLHDLPTGAMDALPGFLDDLLADDICFGVDVPDSCAPISDGTIRWSVDHLVGAP